MTLVFGQRAPDEDAPVFLVAGKPATGGSPRVLATADGALPIFATRPVAEATAAALPGMDGDGRRGEPVLAEVAAPRAVDADQPLLRRAHRARPGDAGRGRRVAAGLAPAARRPGGLGPADGGARGARPGARPAPASDRPPAAPLPAQRPGALLPLRRADGKRHVRLQAQVDGRRARRYVCPNVKHGTGLCDMPPIDAELVDAAVLRRLSADFAGLREWHAALLRGRDARRESVLAEMERDGQRLAKLQRTLPKLRDRLVDALDGDDDAAERAAREALAELTHERDALRERLAAHDAALDALADDTARPTPCSTPTTA